MTQTHRRVGLVMILAAAFALGGLVQRHLGFWSAPPVSSSQRPASPPPLISWQEAAKHYGKYCTVEGKIVLTKNTGKVCFLNFHKEWKRHFTAVIFADFFPRFPSQPERYYLHKTVRVTGIIKDYQGKPEIIVESPEQIEILP